MAWQYDIITLDNTNSFYTENADVYTEHLCYIVDSWTKCYADYVINRAKNAEVPISRSWVSQAQRLLVLHLLNKSEVLVALNKKDNQTIMGYIVYSKKVLHWINVKYPFRRGGIGTTLIRNAFLGEPAQASVITPALWHQLKNWQITVDYETINV